MRFVSIFLQNLFIQVIYLYKYLLSPVLLHNCRFLPTCSDYAIDAIKTHGLLYGIVLTTKRILKCHPFGKAGLDYVPEKKNINKDKKCQI